MAYKDVNSLDTDTTISLGGFNKKLKKDNPTSIEGYYLGKKSVPDSKNPGKTVSIYVFQTPKGNVGVWGKTNLNNKMTDVTLGAMIKITFSGMKPTPRGEMYTYKVQQDLENVLDGVVQQEVNSADYIANDDSYENDYSYEASQVPEEEQQEVEEPPQRLNAAQAAKERQAKTMELLNKSKAARK